MLGAILGWVGLFTPFFHEMGHYIMVLLMGGNPEYLGWNSIFFRGISRRWALDLVTWAGPIAGLGCPVALIWWLAYKQHGCGAWFFLGVAISEFITPFTSSDIVADLSTPPDINQLLWFCLGSVLLSFGWAALPLFRVGKALEERIFTMRIKRYLQS